MWHQNVKTMVSVPVAGCYFDLTLRFEKVFGFQGVKIKFNKYTLINIYHLHTCIWSFLLIKVSQNKYGSSKVPTSLQEI